MQNLSVCLASGAGEIFPLCLYVILSASEISHDQSEKNMPIRNPPSREIAAVAMLPRNDNEKTDCRGRFAYLQRQITQNRKKTFLKNN